MPWTAKRRWSQRLDVFRGVPRSLGGGLWRMARRCWRSSCVWRLCCWFGLAAQSLVWGSPLQRSSGRTYRDERRTAKRRRDVDDDERIVTNVERKRSGDDDERIVTNVKRLSADVTVMTTNVRFVLHVSRRRADSDSRVGCRGPPSVAGRNVLMYFAACPARSGAACGEWRVGVGVRRASGVCAVGLVSPPNRSSGARRCNVHLGERIVTNVERLSADVTSRISTLMSCMSVGGRRNRVSRAGRRGPPENDDS